MDKKNFEKMVNQTFNFNLATEKEDNKKEEEKLLSAKDMLDVARNIVTFFPLGIYFILMFFSKIHASISQHVINALFLLSVFFGVLSIACVLNMLAVFLDTSSSKSGWINKLDKSRKPMAVLFVICVIVITIYLGFIFWNYPDDFLKIFISLKPAPEKGLCCSCPE